MVDASGTANTTVHNKVELHSCSESFEAANVEGF